MNRLPGQVSIVIPGYNEGRNILQNLRYSYSVFLEMFSDFEIIFINDGSTDNTLEQAHEASLSLPNLRVINCESNEGKGNALRVGTFAAQGEFIIFMDADLELPPRQIPRFFELLQSQNADVVIGSKMHPESKIHYPRVRKIVSFSYFVLISFMFNQKFHDTQTGLKVFKSEVIKPVMEKVRIKRFAFDLEMMVMIAKQGYKIVECPVEMEFKRDLKWGRIQFSDILRVMLDTINIFFRYHFSRYYDCFPPKTNAKSS